MKERISGSEWLFFVAYVLWLTFAALNLTYIKGLIQVEGLFTFTDIYDIVKDVVIILLLLKLLDEGRLTMKGFVGIGVVVIIYYISNCADVTNLVIPVWFIFSARNIDYKQIFKVTLWIQGAVMLLSIVLSLSGVILNETWDEATRMRYSLGYTFCTYGSHIFLFMTLMYMSIRKRIVLLEALLLSGLNVLWYLVTDTRIDLLLCIPAIWIVYMWESAHVVAGKGKVLKWLLMLAGPICASVAVLGHFFFDENSGMWIRINNMLNGRLGFGYDAFETYGFTWWGQKIKWVGRGGLRKDPTKIYNYVDSSFVKYLLHYGTIFMILLLIGLVLTGIYVHRTKNKGLMVAFVFWLIYGMIDAELFELAFQPIMLLLSCAFYEKELSERKVGTSKLIFERNKLQWHINGVKWR